MLSADATGCKCGILRGLSCSWRSLAAVARLAVVYSKHHRRGQRAAEQSCPPDARKQDYVKILMIDESRDLVTCTQACAKVSPTLTTVASDTNGTA